MACSFQCWRCLKWLCVQLTQSIASAAPLPSPLIQGNSGTSSTSADATQTCPGTADAPTALSAATFGEQLSLGFALSGSQPVLETGSAP